MQASLVQFILNFDFLELDSPQESAEQLGMRGFKFVVILDCYVRINSWTLYLLKT